MTTLINCPGLLIVLDQWTPTWQKVELWLLQALNRSKVTPLNIKVLFWAKQLVVALKHAFFEASIKKKDKKNGSKMCYYMWAQNSKTNLSAQSDWTLDTVDWLTLCDSPDAVWYQFKLKCFMKAGGKKR